MKPVYTEPWQNLLKVFSVESEQNISSQACLL
jgi:hypothetical protein